MLQTNGGRGHDMRRIHHTSIICALLAFTAIATRPAAAHPHVWVTYEATIVYENGLITGLQHRWTFDDMYTAMAIQGLDKNGDGNYDRSELAELAQVNIDGLKEFDYFSYAKIGSQPIPLEHPKDFWLDYKDGKLSLNFRLPLEKPVLAEAIGFNFSIYDPTYFIAFEPQKTNAVKLAQAPAGCTASMADSKSAKSDAELEALGKALSQELGGEDFGYSMARTVTVSCQKS